MKLSSIIYNKLLLQAEEAKEHEMTKLASAIEEAIGEMPSDDKKEYTYNKLQDDIYNDLWKVATKIIAYYDVNSADVSKIDKVLDVYAEKMIDELETTLGVEEVVKGPFEPKVPGEK